MATRDEILEAVRAFQQRVRQTVAVAGSDETSHASRCIECGEISQCEFERSRE